MDDEIIEILELVKKYEFSREEISTLIQKLEDLDLEMIREDK